MTPAELNTVLAALRLYQDRMTGESPGDDYADIANNGGTVTPLDADGIDALCTKLNVPDFVAYTDGLPLVDALWWFIENRPENSTDLFFRLRERVRENVTPRIVVTIEGGCLQAVFASPTIADALVEVMDLDDMRDDDEIDIDTETEAMTAGLTAIY